VIVDPVQESLTVDVGGWTTEIARWAVWDQGHSRCAERVVLGGRVV